MFYEVRSHWFLSHVFAVFELQNKLVRSLLFVARTGNFSVSQVSRCATRKETIVLRPTAVTLKSMAQRTASSPDDLVVVPQGSGFVVMRREEAIERLRPRQLSQKCKEARDQETCGRLECEWRAPKCRVPYRGLLELLSPEEREEWRAYRRRRSPCAGLGQQACQEHSCMWTHRGRTDYCRAYPRPRTREAPRADTSR